MGNLTLPETGGILRSSLRLLKNTSNKNGISKLTFTLHPIYIQALTFVDLN